MAKKKKTPVGKKISHLRKEGVPEKQAVAEALSMEKAGRLRSDGSYKRVKKFKKRSK